NLSVAERGALDEAERIAAAQGAWELEWGAEFARGTMLFDDHGDAAGALAAYERAAAIADRVGRARLQLATYAARGRIEMKMGRMTDAERSLLHALHVGHAFHDAVVFLEVYHNLAQ